MTDNRAATGIAELDRMLGGGLPRGTFTLLEGPPGSGKSVFAQLFVRKGLENGEGCVYICVDDPPAMVRKQIVEFGWDPVRYEEEGLLAFIDCFSWRIGGSTERYAVLNAMTYDKLTEVVREARSSLRAKSDRQRSVVDSMTTLLPQLPVDDALRLLSWLKARAVQMPGKASLWLAHRTSMKPQLYSILLDNVGGIIELRLKDEPEALIRELRVTAMPFRAPTPRWIPFDIKGGSIHLSL